MEELTEYEKYQLYRQRIRRKIDEVRERLEKEGAINKKDKKK